MCRIDRESDLELVDSAFWTAPRPDHIAERAHGERFLVEVQPNLDLKLGEHLMQHAVAAQEGGLASTVLAHKQRDGSHAGVLCILETAHIP